MKAVLYSVIVIVIFSDCAERLGKVSDMVWILSITEWIRLSIVSYVAIIFCRLPQPKMNKESVEINIFDNYF